MRIKGVPEDFRVEELLHTEIGARGPLAVYALRKTNLTTQEARRQLARALGRSPGHVRCPAQKDKRAVTLQHCSVRMGGMPPDRLAGRGWTAAFLGRLSRHLTPSDLAGNAFTVVGRAVAPKETDALRARWHLLTQEGLPNYYDTQRFGSYCPSLGFPGKHILTGDLEAVLRAYLVEPMIGDPPPIRAYKRKAEGADWSQRKSLAPRSNHRSVLTYLADHPTGFKKAVNLIAPDALALMLHAYQSHLWNRVAGTVVAKALPAVLPLDTPFGPLPLPAQPLAQATRAWLEGTRLPQLHHRLSLDDPQLGAAIAQTLADEGLELGKLKARALERVFLEKGSRQLWLRPTHADWINTEADELSAGCLKITLAFRLPPGSYASLILKAMTATDGCPLNTP